MEYNEDDFVSIYIDDPILFKGTVELEKYAQDKILELFMPKELYDALIASVVNHFNKEELEEVSYENIITIYTSAVRVATRRFLGDETPKNASDGLRRGSVEPLKVRDPGSGKIIDMPKKFSEEFRSVPIGNLKLYQAICPLVEEYFDQNPKADELLHKHIPIAKLVKK